MHIDLNWTSILFRGSLFCCFVFKVYQVFIKQRLREYLDDQLQGLRNEQVEIVEKEALLLSTRKRLESQLHAQRQLFVGIEKKYMQFVGLEKDRVQQEKDILQARNIAIKQKRNLQQKNWRDMVALREAIPAVVDTARVELLEHYNKSNGEEGLKKILKKWHDA